MSPLVAVVAGAWASALALEATGAGEALHHDALLSGGLSLAAVGAFVAVWQLHIAAVMLPSSLPMVGRFDVVVARRPRPGVLRGAFLGGYAAVWTAFALLALAGDLVVHRLVDASPWLHERQGLVLAAVVAVAGTFQLSELKARCLHVCRRPDTFLRLHYRRGTAAAASLGVRHGLFCAGCCWALMLVMAAVGVADLAWMAPLALVMVAERTWRHGDAVVAPVGWTLLGLSLLLALRA